MGCQVHLCLCSVCSGSTPSFCLYLHFHLHFQLHLHHLDTSAASHNGDLVEELYILLPQRIEEHPGNCAPHRSLSAVQLLKQASHVLNLLLDVELGRSDSVVFILTSALLKLDNWLCIVAACLMILVSFANDHDIYSSRCEEPK
jgi:hypothetical protein